jgi:uncharacterized protein YbaR (Trm112 family)
VISKELLEILVCPDDHSSLALAEPKLIAALNERVAAGNLRNRVGDLVQRPLDGGLIREDETLLYPIVDGIPILLVDEGIPLTSR